MIAAHHRMNQRNTIVKQKIQIIEEFAKEFNL